MDEWAAEGLRYYQMCKNRQELARRVGQTVLGCVSYANDKNRCDTFILNSGPIDESLNVAKILPFQVVGSVYPRLVFHFQASNYQGSSIYTRKRPDRHIGPRPSK